MSPEPGKSLHVCLVRPPVVTAPRSLSYYGPVLDLGLAYVAGATRAAGHRVTVVDGPGLAPHRTHPFATTAGELTLHGLRPAEIVEQIPHDADVVGFAHMFVHEWPVLRELLAQVRRRHRDALLVAGGENATAFWRHMLDSSPQLDACVRGEGEHAFTTLLARVAAGRPLDDAPSLASRRNGRPYATPAAPRIAAVDELMWPAWDLFPVEAYLARGWRSGVDRGRSMPVLTSRGCPYRCTFCSAPQMWTTRYHRRKPELVLDEIEHYVHTYGIDNVDINDLTALLTKEWILELCRGIQRRGLSVTWQLPSGTRSEAVDREAAEAMVAAGCRNFCYAPESGSPAELRRIQKRVDPEALATSLQAAVEAGMRTHASIIIGFPDQSAADVRLTWRYLLRLARIGLHTASVMVFAPYPGSQDYERLAAQGAIEHDEAWTLGSLLRSAGAGRSHHRRWSTRRLAALQLTMLGSFFALQYVRRPWRLGGALVNVVRRRQQTVMDQFLSTKLDQFRRGLRRRWARLVGLGGSEGIDERSPTPVMRSSRMGGRA